MYDSAMYKAEIHTYFIVSTRTEIYRREMQRFLTFNVSLKNNLQSYSNNYFRKIKQIFLANIKKFMALLRHYEISIYSPHVKHLISLKSQPYYLRLVSFAFYIEVPLVCFRKVIEHNRRNSE